MLRRIDRILLRVPSLQAAVRYYRDVLGLTLVREDRILAILRLPDDETEVVLHNSEDLPAEATYYLVDDVRALFELRADLQVQFVQPPTPVARGYRAAIRDPFGNVLLIVDRTNVGGAPAEDARAPGMLFPGIEPDIPVNRDALVAAYQAVGRTADDLPYTPDFEKLYALYSAAHRDARATRQEVWRRLLNLRKGSLLPKLGEARSVPPEISPEDRHRLLAMLGEDVGRRDRLPYTDRFDQLVDEFNRTQARPLSPHLVWRLVATLAK